MTHQSTETPTDVATRDVETCLGPSAMSQLTAGLLLSAGLLLGTPAQAISSGEAYGYCKQAAKQAHGPDSSVSLKKLRKRGGGKTEVRLRVVTDAGAFRADCVLENDQVVAYTPSDKAPDSSVAASN